MYYLLSYYHIINNYLNILLTISSGLFKHLFISEIPVSPLWDVKSIKSDNTFDRKKCKET